MINRLEEIESILKDYEELKEKRDFEQAETALLYLCENHIDYLIQQAEKVQELEAENESLRTRRDHLAYRLKVRREENQRYKKVKEELEAIYDVEDAEHPFIKNEYIGGYMQGLDEAIGLLEEAKERETE